MGFLDRLERRFGRFAVRRLVFYIVVANAAVFVVDFFLDFGGGASLANQLALMPSRVAAGEIWRLVTFIFVPGSGSFLTIIQLYFMYLIGMFLERSWSAFRLNIYYLVGMLASIAASFALGVPADGSMLNTSLFLAFASVAPEMQVLLFFFIPVKVKWLGWLTWGFLAFSFVMAVAWSVRILVLAQVANYLLFFWPDIVERLRGNRMAYTSRQRFEDSKAGRDPRRGGGDWGAGGGRGGHRAGGSDPGSGEEGGRRRRKGAGEDRGKVLEWRPKESDAGGASLDAADQDRGSRRGDPKPFHRCDECGATEISNPDYDFRYCSKCKGDHEFCMEHLASHAHRDG